MNTNMSEDSSSGNKPAMRNQEDDFNSEARARIITQEDVNDQRMSFITTPTPQRKSWTTWIGQSGKGSPLNNRTSTQGQVPVPVLTQPFASLIT